MCQGAASYNSYIDNVGKQKQLAAKVAEAFQDFKASLVQDHCLTTTIQKLLTHARYCMMCILQCCGTKNTEHLF